MYECSSYLPRGKLFEQNDAALLVHLLALLESGDYQVTRREPGVCIVVEPVQKFRPDQGRSL